MTVQLTPALRDEYQQLFDTCVVAASHTQEIESAATKIAASKPRYSAVADPLAIPWYVVGLIHCMEASLSFKTHLHNGDPLTAKTVHVPKGRPDGNPPFTWEVSATDALKLDGFDKVAEWSLPSTLYNIEKFNGFGYRSRGINTPYLWSFSNHYAAGKFVSDGVFSATAVSNQTGAAVILRRLVERGDVTLQA